MMLFWQWYALWFPAVRQLASALQVAGARYLKTSFELMRQQFSYVGYTASWKVFNEVSHKIIKLWTVNIPCYI